MVNLIEKTKDELIKIAKRARVSARGTKEEITARIEKSGAAPQPRGMWINPETYEASKAEVERRVDARRKAEEKDRKALEKRIAKRGGTIGEAE